MIDHLRFIRLFGLYQHQQVPRTNGLQDGRFLCGYQHASTETQRQPWLATIGTTRRLCCRSLHVSVAPSHRNHG